MDALSPVSPAEILREEFGHSWPDGARIDERAANDLSFKLGPTPAFFLNLQARYDALTKPVDKPNRN